ncbi:MAG: SDR family oxidoreductase [Candidatus Ozemobacteraceae bacterium]
MITGSATGIGVRIAIELARRNFSIIINYLRSKREAEELVGYLETTFAVKAIAIQGNLAENLEAERVFAQAHGSFGRIDVLVNNVGPFIRERKKLAEYSTEEWFNMLNGNLSSVFFMSRLVIPVMRVQGFGRIINIGFERADTAPGWIHRSAYAAGKTGLVSLTRTMALEEAENKITVNMVCPGDIKSPWKSAEIKQVDTTIRECAPVGRSGTGEDIGRVIAFLCEEDSNFITGAIIEVTGGIDVLGRHRSKTGGFQKSE